MDGIDKPHDALVRRMLEHMDQARVYFQSVVPPPLAAQIDWSSIAPMDSTFVSPELARRFTDLLFSVSIAGKQGILCLLLEHQSERDFWMALRFLEYLSKAYAKWHEQHDTERYLPVIVPVLLSHAKGGWNVPCSFDRLFDDTSTVFELTKRYVPRFEYLLDDLTLQTDDEIKSRVCDAWAALALLLLKNGREKQNLATWLLKAAPDLLRAVWAGPRGRSLLTTLIWYIFTVSDQTPNEDLTQSVKHLLGKEAGDLSMTVAEQLISQGKAEGAAELRLAIADLCEVLGIEMTAERTRHLSQLDLAGLGQLRIAIKSNRAWPEPSLFVEKNRCCAD